MKLKELIKELEAIYTAHGDVTVYGTAYGATYDPGLPEVSYRYEKRDAHDDDKLTESLYSGEGSADPEMHADYNARFVEKCVLIAGI